MKQNKEIDNYKCSLIFFERETQQVEDNFRAQLETTLV